MTTQPSQQKQFEQYIKTWVGIDDQLRQLNDQVKSLRNQKSETTSFIMKLVKNTTYEKAIINITDGRLKFVEVKQAQSITFKYLEDCLTKCLPEAPDKVEEIMNYVKTHREVKTTPDIKRTFNHMEDTE
jgi:septal ring factor EnvC (AmiA/AmiB activator)